MKTNSEPDGRRPAVTVIIATTCEAKRARALQRAIESVLMQEGVEVELLVVVNGKRFDQQLFDRLKSDSRLSLHYLEEASYPAAIKYGRSLVTNEFFSYLDDDDEYLPGALLTRVTPLLEDDKIDFVATNGYLHFDGRDVIAYHASDTLEQEPLAELLKANWMTSCGNMFRASTVVPDYFDGTTKYYEWTLLAFRLALKLTLKFINTPTYRRHDTPQSLSKSVGGVEGEIVVIDTMIALNTSESLRNNLIKLRCSALHTTSDFHRKSGNYVRAWKFHLRSLGHPYGWKYLLYTRRLLLPVARNE